MAQLAIKGHPTRGKEVIEILEMLGGKNKQGYNGKYNSLWYYIDVRSEICVFKYSFDGCIFFTLEEFLEKFPYKVGDKVRDERINDSVGEIIIAQWDDNENQIIYLVEWDDVTKSTLPYFARDLQLYEEETKEEKLEQITLDIPKGYEFFGINDDNQVVLAKKQLQYPKTYNECCKVLMGKTNFQDFSLVLTKLRLRSSEENSIILSEPPYIRSINVLYKLFICRDAYWKIAGEQMGLGKPWKPDWREERYIIYRNQDDIIGGYREAGYVEHHILAFPTKEMRDAFKKNFDRDIDVCKEFL